MSISSYFHAFGLPKKIVALEKSVALAFWDEMKGGGFFQPVPFSSITCLQTVSY